MSHWTEEAIAKALEGRFYNIHGICEREIREKQKRRAASAASAVHDHTRQRVRKIIKTRGARSPEAIVAATAFAHGIGSADLISKSRKKNIIAARHHACALIRELTGIPFPAICIAVGLSDHSTAQHACKVWKVRGQAFAAQDAAIRQMLGVG